MCDEAYEVHIVTSLMCTCKDFVEPTTQGHPYLACKHIYYVHLCVLGLNKIQDMEIHQLTLSQADVTKMLSRPQNDAVCAHT